MSLETRSPSPPPSARMHRQRSNSETMADDLNVQATNDDASQCKFWAVQLGYYHDPYIGLFVKHSEHRPAPEINRGYFARVKAVQMLLQQFFKVAGPSGQVISLGAGFDTTFWLLKDAGVQFEQYIEIDFAGVTAKKIHFIMKPQSPLLLALSSDETQVKQVEHMDLHAPHYHLIGADLRNVRDLKSKLEATGLRCDAPTLVLSECVMVYITAEQSSNLLTFLASYFPTSCFVNYEQVNIDDRFGQIMQDNLHSRGVCLAGVAPCHDLESQKRRFLDAGYSSVKGWDMNAVYADLPKDEVLRTEGLEPLDEKELLTQLFSHYCITVACKDTRNVGLDRIGL